MKNITEQQILSLAPNAAAAANGKKIASGGGFLRLFKSADDTFFMGECKGSGKNPYITSADYVDPEKPVYRCSCPSRQFPCKHSLALMYEMMNDKPFEPCEIPEDILKKRAKIAAKNAPEAPEAELAPEEAEKREKKKASAAKTALNAKKKKLQKQLEGLELCKKALDDLISAGLGTMGGTSVANYKNISKQLGDYYLNGPQRLLNSLIIEIEAFHKDGKEIHCDNAIDIIEKLGTLIKKSRAYINEKLESGNIAPEDNVLYEELGEAWKISELEAIGKCEKNVRLAQLAFWVSYDEGAKEYTDTGAWLELSEGKVYLTKNYRPVKSLKYIKADDTVFGAADVPSMAVYPGEGNVRVRWDGGSVNELTEKDYDKIRSLASPSVTKEEKEIKNLLKNSLQSPILFKLIEFREIGKINGSFALRQSCGDILALKDFPELKAELLGTVERLEILPRAALENGAILCGFFYDSESRKLCAQPISIIPKNENTVVRLLY